MPKSLSEKRTVWSENTLEERLLNDKHWTKKKKIKNLNLRLAKSNKQ